MTRLQQLEANCILAVAILTLPLWACWKWRGEVSAMLAAALPIISTHSFT